MDGVVGWVAHVILVSAQVPIALGLGLGLGLDNIETCASYFITRVFCRKIRVIPLSQIIIIWFCKPEEIQILCRQHLGVTRHALEELCPLHPSWSKYPI